MGQESWKAKKDKKNRDASFFLYQIVNYTPTFALA